MPEPPIEEDLHETDSEPPSLNLTREERWVLSVAFRHRTANPSDIWEILIAHHKMLSRRAIEEIVQRFGLADSPRLRQDSRLAPELEPLGLDDDAAITILTPETAEPSVSRRTLDQLKARSLELLRAAPGGAVRERDLADQLQMRADQVRKVRRDLIEASFISVWGDSVHNRSWVLMTSGALDE